MSKANCSNCQYKENVPGDAHICCRHPKIAENPELECFAALGIGGATSPASAELNIQANSHGVKMGWFMWPVNFDPVWLENCDGFKEKE